MNAIKRSTATVSGGMVVGDGGAGEHPANEQLQVVRARVHRSEAPPPGPAADLPVARVAVDVSLAHLDRPFDYLVPEPMAAEARPGVRVRVRFAGQLVDGLLLDRVAASDHPGRLARLTRVVSPEPVLAPEVARLARLVADRYAGTMADVLRLAVPPRHARVEAQPSPASAPAPPQPPPGPWRRYDAGPALLTALGAGEAPRAVWDALPGADWPTCLALAAAAALSGGRGALVVAPDHRDVVRLDAAFAEALGPGRHVALTSDLGPGERYRRWLALRRGAVRAVVGTRAAMFAPVADLGLVAVWDDGDDLHSEPRAPYPHVREVLLLRAHDTGAAALVGGFPRTAEGARLLATGWARPLSGARTVVRAAAPRVQATGDEVATAQDPAAGGARLPTVAWRTAHEALATGPVLVQVPRRGYLPRLACGRCRQTARCPHCAGPLTLASAHAVAHCRWCGRPAGGWRCPACGERRFRAQVVGAGRTADELGRAFPRVAVRRSGRDGVLARVGPEPALVVATPGAEPVADDGYAAALLLDGWALLGRADLRAAEEALRRWMNAAALVRPAGEGGRVVVLAEAAQRPVQALLRWDPATHAERELSDRTALSFPPAVAVAALTGQPSAVADLLEVTELPPGVEVLGPVPAPRPATGPRDAGEPVRTLLRVARPRAAALAAALHAGQAVRSAAKAAGTVRVQIDPLELA